jgi:predicted DNA-binding protein (MmcQ/YjbR family)
MPFMNSNALLKFCAALPHAKLDRKWGHVMACCVHEKMFALFAVDENGKAEKYSFKADPERFLELTDRKGVIPAPYLARAKWVAVVEDKALSEAEAKALLSTAHQLIVRKLPKYLQREIASSN